MIPSANTIPPWGLKIPVSAVRFRPWAQINPEIPGKAVRVFGCVPAICAELQANNSSDRISSWTAHANLVRLLVERGVAPHEAFGSLACAGPATWVYFVQAPGIGLIKIGQTTDLPARMSALQGSSPVPLTLLVAARAPGIVEHVLHEYFEEHRRHGEWFRAAPDLLDLIDRLKVAS